MTEMTKKVGRLYREKLVQEVKDGISNNDNVFLLSYTQISGLQMNDLRKDLNRTGANVVATKNRIAKLALTEIDQKDLADKISGQTALVWGGNDSSEISKVIIDFVKKSGNVTVHGGLLQGRLLAECDVKKLSELPSRDVLLSMLLSTLQAPLSRLAGALNAKTRDLLSVLKQLSEKKGGNDNG